MRGEGERLLLPKRAHHPAFIALEAVYSILSNLLIRFQLLSLCRKTMLAVSHNKRYAKVRLELLDTIGADIVRGAIDDYLSNGLPDNVLQHVAALMLDARATSSSNGRNYNNKARGNPEQRKVHTPSGLIHLETATPSEHPIFQDPFTVRPSP
jgi:hypothetical protein